MTVYVDSGKTIEIDTSAKTCTITYGGAQGPKGDTGANGSLAWHDDWASDHGTYYANDFVYHSVSGYGKGLFRCIAENNPSIAANEPVIGASKDTYWEESVQGGQNGEVIMDGTPAEHDIMIRGSDDKHIETSGAQVETTLTSDSDAKIPTSEAVAEYVAALESTDRQVVVNHCNAAYTSAGTWTVSESTNALIVTRTAAQADHYRTHGPIALPARTTASKGAKLISVALSCVVGGTPDTTNDVLSVNIIKQTVPTDGSAVAASVLAGDDDADYDTNNNTNAKRLAVANHTLTVTIPVGERAFIATGEEYYVRLRVKEASGTALTFVLTGIVANYSEIDH